MTSLHVVLIYLGMLRFVFVSVRFSYDLNLMNTVAEHNTIIYTVIIIPFF